MGARHCPHYSGGQKLENIMKKFALAAAFTLAASTAFAGNLTPPVMEEVVVVQDTSSSSGGLIIPILLVVLLAAAASN